MLSRCIFMFVNSLLFTLTGIFVYYASYGVKWCLTELSGLSILAFMKPDPKSELTVLNLRDMPRDVIAKIKAAAALEHASLKEYVAKILDQHVTELEKKGILPKGK